MSAGVNPVTQARLDHVWLKLAELRTEVRGWVTDDPRKPLTYVMIADAVGELQERVARLRAVERKREVGG